MRTLQANQDYAPCRKRTGEAAPRAEKIDDLITANHKILNEEGESRINHRYAVVVKNLAIQWIQSSPCKTKTAQETERRVRKFLEPSEKQKVIYTGNSFEFGKTCEDLSWNHCTSTLHRSETNGIAQRMVRRRKEGTSAELLQSGLDEKWRADCMECYCYLRNVQDILADGRTPYELRFGEPFRGQVMLFGAIVEYHPISAKDQSRLHQLGKKVLPGIFLGYPLFPGGIWKVDILVADIEELETLDASEIHARRLNAKEIIIPKNGEHFRFLIADGTPKLSGRDQGIRKSILTRDQLVRSEDQRPSGKFGEVSTNRRNQKEARNVLKSLEGHFIYRHHVEPRVQLYVPKEETFTIPLKYINVTRITHTNLDVLQESRMDDYWNVDVDRSLSDSWTGFTKLKTLHGKPPKGNMWSGERLTKIQATTRTDHLWPEIWTKMSKAAQKKEEHQYSTEKPKLDNARKLKGIYFIDPEE